MNRKRRAELERVKDMVTSMTDRLIMVAEDERASMDNMPENLQTSMRFSDMEDASDAIDDAVDSLRDAVEKIEEAMM